MVVRIKTGKNIKGALNYNEQKVQQGTAELILASNFSRDVSDMGFSEKLARFEKIIALNEKSKTTTLHLSLNFSPDDDVDTEKMQQIVADYMDRIGFGNQPYLVYRHDDTSHPHIHIVTTTIRPNGKSIYLHNIGKRLSEPARKAIEQEFGLIKAEDRKRQEMLPLKPVELGAAYYGKSETKRVISNIVREVVSRYRFTSLDELNAILRQYNVVADRGSLNSRIYQNGGLIYSIVDKDGYKTGIPIKASSIYTSPTFSALEKKFEQNRVTRHVFQNKVRNTVLSALHKSNTIASFIDHLREKNIRCSFSYEKDGSLKDISFVDHINKSVFSCQDLGISVNELFDQLSNLQTRNLQIDSENSGLSKNIHEDSIPLTTTTSFDLLKTLLISQAYQPDLSAEFLRKRKKKRKP